MQRLKIHKNLFISFLKLITLSSVLLLNSCSEKKKSSLINPNQVANKTFDLLKDIDKISSKEFENRITSYEDIKLLSDDSSVPLGDYIRNDIKTITPESHEKISLKDYQEIKSRGIEYGIKWDKIELVNFKHEISNIEGGKMLLMETYFKNYDNKIYFVKTAAVFDGIGYVPIKIAEIEPKHKEGAF